MIEKFARKPSTDPAQEKLRQAKADWNAKVSALINSVIHAKKLMNGWPNKFNKTRTRIQDPIPENPASILDRLASEFNDLAHQGGAIAQQQLEYSKTRRLPRKQQAEQTLNQLEEKHGPTSPSIPSPFANIASFEKYDLTAQGSNKLTRTFTRLTNPTFGYGTGTKRRRYRMVMLKRCAKIHKALGKMQAKIISPFSGFKGVKEAHDMIQDIINELKLVSDSFNLYKGLIEKTKVPDKENVSFDDTRVKAIKEDLASVIGGKIYNAAPFTALNKDIDAFFASKNDEEKAKMEPQIVLKYGNLLRSIMDDFGVSGNSLKEIENEVSDQLNKQKPGQLETVAQAFIKKWIGKARHNLLPNDSSDYRLAIYDTSESARNELNDLMNIVEMRNPPIDEMERLVRGLQKDMNDIRTHIYNLYRVIVRDMESKKK
jgi:hypothetical protein